MGAFVENDETGEKIYMEWVGDTFEMVLKTKKFPEGMQKEMKWAEVKRKKFRGMEVDANEEEKGDEEMAAEVDGGKEGTAVSRGGC